jgi:hypothetical protein
VPLVVLDGLLESLDNRKQDQQRCHRACHVPWLAWLKVYLAPDETRERNSFALPTKHAQRTDSARLISKEVMQHTSLLRAAPRGSCLCRCRSATRPLSVPLRRPPPALRGRCALGHANPIQLHGQT